MNCAKQKIQDTCTVMKWLATEGMDTLTVWSEKITSKLEFQEKDDCVRINWIFDQVKIFTNEYIVENVIDPVPQNIQDILNS